MPDDPLEVNDALSIPFSELTFRATRSGGPGGQHVNTSATRVEVSWDVAASPSLSEAQRERLLEKLANRIDSSGTLRVVAATERSQHRNRQEATERLRTLVERALRRRKPRRRTRVPRAQKEKRLREKKRRSETKRLRGKVEGE